MNDTISLGSVTSAAVYGAAGADTWPSGTTTNSYLDGVTGAMFDATTATGSTVIGLGADSLDFSGAVHLLDCGGDGVAPLPSWNSYSSTVHLLALTTPLHFRV